MLVLIMCILSLAQMSTTCSVPELCPTQASIQQEILDVHNNFRRSVVPTASNMLKMNWSVAAAESAQKWVDNCNMTHGPPSTRMIGTYECGENLFKGSSPVSWTTVITAWHSEVTNYKYAYGSINGKAIGHYTQVVWYSSYEVGCGVAQCGSSYFYACHYYRAGNFRGVPPYSLGTPCSACPNACEDNLCTNPCPYINKYINCPSLKDEATCDNYYVKTWCPALCQCDTEIIPIARK
ncbi:cysteine-rich venom protein [Chanos chanos]|uniref:Cysteine-rich venom protein n=1 Tax=Chanos chanos TaxID=29144 RepID=A0A6J2WBB2_CHACN|nr:cysteine-rich venom protein-like [Chanos chanos]